MLIVAGLVNAVTAEHKDDGPRRCKHVLSTNWTVTVRDALYAFMRMLNGH